MSDLDQYVTWWLADRFADHRSDAVDDLVDNAAHFHLPNGWTVSVLLTAYHGVETMIWPTGNHGAAVGGGAPLGHPGRDLWARVDNALDVVERVATWSTP